MYFNCSIVSDHGMDLLAGVVAVNFHSSPEISIGGSRCSTASDVWSLGIILLQLFTVCFFGMLTFHGHTFI